MGMYIVIGLFIFLLCYVFTPIVKHLAWKIGAVDVPLDGRRMHRRSIPRDGGVAIFGAFFIGLALLNTWDAFLTCFVLVVALWFWWGLPMIFSG
jgi:UDP-GlcNAc:undecaprenyl-phosphate GlcNAc-1-phosphate transferase